MSNRLIGTGPIGACPAWCQGVAHTQLLAGKLIYMKHSRENTLQALKGFIADSQY